MKRHKFLLGNPCGPCEWHIEADVRIFAWFDLIFQSVFVVPVILQLRIFVNIDQEEAAKERKATTTTTTTTLGSTTMQQEDEACDFSLLHLAILYSILDIINLSIGIVSDLLMYIGTKQGGLCFNKFCVMVFLIASVIREILHITGVYLHVVRCKPETYAYEIIVRLMCQYMVWGVWIAVEYYRWLSTGRNFVPQRGNMEPKPSVIVNMMEDSTTATDYTISTDFSALETPASAMTLAHSGQIRPDQIQENPKVLEPKDTMKEEAAGAGSSSDGLDGPDKKAKPKRKSGRKSKPGQLQIGGGDDPLKAASSKEINKR